MRFISKNENKFLLIAFAVILVFSVTNISAKLIRTYNLDVELKQKSLRPSAGSELPFFGVSECYFLHPQSNYFTLFSLFLFIITAVFRKSHNLKYQAEIAFGLFSIWFLNLFFLPKFFLYLANIESNTKLFKFDEFDLIVWILFLIVTIYLTLSLLRFAVVKFQDKISLR